MYSGNPNLDPETVTSFDFGVQQALWNDASVTATVFRYDLSNMIYRRTITPQFREYANTGRARTKGVEFDVEQRLSFGRIFGNHTWTDARILENETAPETEGMRITRVPTHTGLLSAELEFGNLGVSLTGRHIGKRFGLDNNADTTNGIFGSYDPFTLFDVKTTYRFRSFDASFSIDNLLDRAYYDYYLAPGRMATVVLGYTL
jgi:iron complex outermembrane receptor protein